MSSVEVNIFDLGLVTAKGFYCDQRKNEEYDFSFMDLTQKKTLERLM